MKRKKIIITVCAVAVLAIAGVGTLMHMNAAKSGEVENVAVGATGTHCNGTVGCSCSGFSPKTNVKSGKNPTARSVATTNVTTINQ